MFRSPFKTNPDADYRSHPTFRSLSKGKHSNLLYYASANNKPLIYQGQMQHNYLGKEVENKNSHIDSSRVRLIDRVGSSCLIN